MLFNSLPFIIFLPLVFALYWLLQRRHVNFQNCLLLAASYVFYGWWDYRFLSLIFISSLVDFLVGLALNREERSGYRKLLLILSLTVNLGILGFFKYYGFFVESFADLVQALGLQPNISTLRIILPIGISFYTFQTLSYSIDLYRRQIQATRDPISFFAFVSFFPQLVAGPIERAKNLLPQFQMKRRFDIEHAKDGMRQMLWGILKKVVVADNLAPHVDEIYANYNSMDGVALFIGTFLFAFQIYCDFSGYSDIAIGTARLFGFRLMRNFAFPYFSRDIAEFWRRWHISLSSWFRDYVYIPMGGSLSSKMQRIRNIVITFMVSGLWHGANWTFIVWGLLHGLYYIPFMLMGWHKKHAGEVAEGRLFPGIREIVCILITFMMVFFAWIFFRAETITDALRYIVQMLGGPLFGRGIWHGQYISSIIYVLALALIEWIQRDRQHGLEIDRLPIVARWPIYVATCLLVIELGNFGAVEFIYFQF